MTSPELYEFGDVTVDVLRVEVRRSGEAVAFEPKAFDVLCHLIRNRDRLVAKEELLDVVWGKDTFVTPNVLTRVVAQLRKGLGDDAFEARYIETVSKRGYRFIAPVVVAHGAGASAAVAAEPPRSLPDIRPRRVGPTAAILLLLVVAVATWSWLGRRDRPASGSQTLYTPQRLTAARANYGFPALSPDGSAVAYASERAGRHEIHVLGLAPGSRELAITDDGGDNVEPAFSPDGRWLAYRSAERGGIWVVPATGGVPRRVAEFGSSPSWSPDSQALVFSSRAGLSSQGVLFTVRRDGTSTVPLTQPGTPPGGHAAPAWSHDGRLVAFMVGRHEAREIWVLKASGGEPRRLAVLTRFSRPRFAPDDRALYWLGSAEERNDCLMRVKLTRDGDADGEPERVLTFQGQGIDELSIARNGTAVYQWNRRSVNLFAVELDGSGAAAGPPRALTRDEDATNRYAQIAPDGRIAWEQQVSGRPITAWVMEADGGNPQPLSAGLSAAVRIPQWDAAVGRLFTVVEPGQAEGPYYAWLDFATRQLERIPLSAEGRENMPALSPDGRQLALHRIAPGNLINLWVQPLDGSRARQVTFDREAVSYPRWSRDGRWLVANIKRGEDIHLAVVPAQGGPLEQVTSRRGRIWGYSFAPDGDRLVFAHTEGEADSSLYVVSRRTKQATLVAPRGRWPAFSPRGDRIVYSSAEHTASLWTLRVE